MPTTRLFGVVAGVGALAALAPTMMEVYGELGSATELPVIWLLAIVGFVATGFVSGWALTRIALRADGWFDIVPRSSPATPPARSCPPGDRSEPSFSCACRADPGSISPPPPRALACSRC